MDLEQAGSLKERIKCANINEDQNEGGGVRIISITSGKGGVGKTNMAANLAYAMTTLGKKVLVLDANLGMGNIDVLLGLTHEYHIGHVLSGEKKISEILLKGPNGMLILPAGSGVQELSALTEGQKIAFISELDNLNEAVDVLLVDTGSGISSNVLYFNASAQEIIIVVSPEPTSLADCYAMMKVLFQKHGERRFKLIVNSVKNAKEGLDVYNNLCMAADTHLDISMDYLGSIPYDENLPKAVREQKIVSEMYPHSRAGEAFFEVAKTILGSEPCTIKGNIQFLWKRLIGA